MLKKDWTMQTTEFRLLLEHEACKRFTTAHRALVDFTLSANADGSLYVGRVASDKLDALRERTDRTKRRWERALMALGIPPPRD
jgi:hypothetical protein